MPKNPEDLFKDVTFNPAVSTSVVAHYSAVDTVKLFGPPNKSTSVIVGNFH